MQNTAFYGFDTSVGFDNIFQAYAFPTKAERDSFVIKHEDRNLSVKPITAAAAKKIAGKPDWSGKRLFLTPDGSVYL